MASENLEMILQIFKTIFAKVLLIFIHFILSIFIGMSCFFRWTCNIIIDKFSNSSFESIILDKEELIKVPTHIGFVLNEESVDYDSLSNLTLWSFLCGVKYITIADTNEVLESKVFMKMLTNICNKQSLSEIDLMSFHDHKINLSSSAKYNIIFTSVDYQRREFLKSVQSFGENSEYVKKIKFNIDAIDSVLKNRSNDIQDPDLLVSFGSFYSTFGYAPWDLRLTEIINLQTHHHFFYSDFISILQRFSTCKQRFGK